MRPLFPFFFPFSRVKRARQTPPPNITRATVHHISSVCVCVCACACVVYTRTRYTSVCARGINLRAFHDNCAGSYCCRLEAVSSVVAPTLLLFGWCSSFCSQRRAPPFATARYSVFVVGSSRKSNDLKSYAATPTTPIQHAVSLLRTRRTCLLSSLRFKGSWNEIVSKGKETI